MTNSVSPVSPSAFDFSASTPAPTASASQQPAADTNPPPQADLRLVIEEDKTSGAFVYKSVDVLTGEVIQQFPREEILKLKDDASYSPGDLVDSRA